MPDTDTISTTVTASPAFTAAQEVASLINALWQSDSTKPTVFARLSPLVNSNDGTEALPVAYAIPIEHALKRESRCHYGEDIQVAFVFVSEADEIAAQTLLAEVYLAVRTVLDAGMSNGVHFVDADIVEPYDYDLLANSGIFRSQANFQITMVTKKEA